MALAHSIKTRLQLTLMLFLAIFAGGWAVLYSVLDRMHPQPSGVLLFLGVFGMIFLLLLLAAGVNLYRAVCLPLAHLEIHVRDVARGQLSRRLELDAFDEIRALADSFNGMAENLSSTLVSKGFLDSVIGSMAEAVLLVDTGYVLESINRAGLEMLDYEEPELLGKPLEMILRGRDGEAAAAFFCFGGSIETHFIARDGRRVPVLFSSTLIRDEAEGRDRILCVATDVSLLKSAELELRENKDHLRRLAYYDSLTCLPNRLLFQDRFGRALAQARRRQEQVAVLFLDLDRFKNINDSLGHGSGDRVLVEASRRLQSCLRKSDTVARLGGDEFVVLLEGVEQPEQVSQVAEKILEVLQQVMVIEGHDLYVTASIGIGLYPHDGQDEEALMKNADTAMYSAKAQGRNAFRYYSEGMNARARELLAMEGRLRKAVDQGEFHLVYQPQIDLGCGELVGMEALLRWNDPAQGMASPADFIPLAEESGLIVPLGDWVLRQACRQARRWKAQGLPPIRIAVNISARQFRQARFVERISGIFTEAGVDPCWFELEITESTLMENTAEAVEILRRLKRLGFQLAIDDFGTGFSSLGYLKTFPIDKLKIDRSFVRDVVFDANDSAIAISVISLARSMNLQVVAEGIETPEQLRFLQNNGCELGQGYLFSNPLPSECLVSEQVSPPVWPCWNLRPGLRAAGAG